jgi:hypothetical protein
MFGGSGVAERLIFSQGGFSSMELGTYFIHPIYVPGPGQETSFNVCLEARFYTCLLAHNLLTSIPFYLFVVPKLSFPGD